LPDRVEFGSVPAASKLALDTTKPGSIPSGPPIDYLGLY
jgi:hypothetical protein